MRTYHLAGLAVGGFRAVQGSRGRRRAALPRTWQAERGATRAGIAVALVCLLGLCTSAVAHEYWLDPESYHPVPGEPLAIDIRNGQDFVGTSYPFDADRYRALYRLDTDGRHALPGRLGDYPAIRFTPAGPGLQFVVLTTRPQMLNYETLEDFRTFLDYHGLGSVMDVHRQRELPETNIQESYLRFAKALVAVDPGNQGKNGNEGEGEDNAQAEARVLAAQGLELELVALASPYAAREKIPLELQFRGRQLAGAQLEVFVDEGQGKVHRTVYRTDERGRVDIPVGDTGKYLVNAVQVLQPRAGSGPVHWESLWASLTFEIEAPVN